MVVAVAVDVVKVVGGVWERVRMDQGRLRNVVLLYGESVPVVLSCCLAGWSGLRGTGLRRVISRWLSMTIPRGIS